MLSKRLAIGIPMAVVFVLILWLDEFFAPWYPLWFATVLAGTGLAAAEIVALFRNTTIRASPTTVFGGLLAIVVANWAPHVTEATGPKPVSQVSHETKGEKLAPVEPTLTNLEPAFDPAASVDALAWPMLTFVALMMVAFVSRALRYTGPGSAIAVIAGSLLAVAYVGLLGSFLIQLRWFDHGLIPLAALVATAKGTDTGAYTFGRIAGRHKLWPALSPNKTIEGAIGGLACGVLGALAVVAFAREVLDLPSLGWAEAVAFGLLVSAAAQIGDLMESMIKRDCEVKDASNAVPGFGGVLDVIDSLLFAAPVAFGHWLLFGP